MRLMRGFITLVMLGMTCACESLRTAAPPPPPPPPPPIVRTVTASAAVSDSNTVFYASPVSGRTVATPAATETGKKYAVVRVFFATDRNLTGSEEPAAMFGVERSEMRYGFSDVSIPPGHSTGELESPSIWRLEISENPEKHVVLLESKVLGKEQYFLDIANRIKTSADSSALVFVHGYNVTFEDAARRTAQMSYDLRFGGAPIFFSWPSKGDTALYTHDEATIEWAETDLKRFLDDVLTRSEAKNVYIVAHSMGNRAVTRALGTLLAEKRDLRPKVKEIILAAPDIDAGTFKSAIAPALVGAGRPITLYASSDDKALQASRKVHGEARLGNAGKSLVVMPGVETVDATGVDTSFVAHSYYGSIPAVLADIYHIIHNSLRAYQRASLQPAGSPTAVYWMFAK